METEKLIRGLASDSARSSPRLSAIFAAALGVSAILAAAAFGLLLGPRSDFQLAATTPRFLFKFVVTLALVATAAAAAFATARPGVAIRPRLLLLAAVPLLLGAAVVVEFMTVPPDEWTQRWIGTNVAICLTFIPVIGSVPLAVTLAAMRRAAPTRPRLAGALAGFLAGGIAASFYAAHCTDDSPFFVATWYTLAVAVLAVAGTLAGDRLLRW